MLRFNNESIEPFELPGNRLVRTLYDELPLPWDIATPVTAFPKKDYVRHEIDRDGVPSNGVSYFAGWQELSFGEIEKILNTISMVTRWREAYPDLAGTEKDVVKAFLAELQGVLGPGVEKVSYGSSYVILLFKKA
jgi:hypothetical protein